MAWTEISRPHRCKTGLKHAVEDGHGRRIGDFDAAGAAVEPLRLPAGLGSGYSANLGG